MAEILFLVWVGVVIVLILVGAVIGFMRATRYPADWFLLIGGAALGGFSGLAAAVIVTFLGLLVTSALGVWS